MTEHISLETVLARVIDAALLNKRLYREQLDYLHEVITMYWVTPAKDHHDGILFAWRVPAEMNMLAKRLDLKEALSIVKKNWNERA